MLNITTALCLKQDILRLEPVWTEVVFCWAWRADCRVNWTAFGSLGDWMAAVATFGAVLYAVFQRGRESKRSAASERIARQLRSQAVAAALYPEVRELAEYCLGVATSIGVTLNPTNRVATQDLGQDLGTIRHMKFIWMEKLADGFWDFEVDQAEVLFAALVNLNRLHKE